MPTLKEIIPDIENAPSHEEPLTGGLRDRFSSLGVSLLKACNEVAYKSTDELPDGVVSIQEQEDPVFKTLINRRLWVADSFELLSVASSRDVHPDEHFIVSAGLHAYPSGHPNFEEGWIEDAEGVKKSLYVRGIYSGNNPYYEQGEDCDPHIQDVSIGYDQMPAYTNIGKTHNYGSFHEAPVGDERLLEIMDAAAKRVAELVGIEVSVG